MPSENFESRSARQLLDLAGALDLPLVGMAILTTLPSSFERACFRLDLADGRVLKGRVVGHDDDAARIESLTKLLDARHFPKVLARRGCVMLTEWINGTPLSPTDCDPELLASCGSLQGLVHSIRFPREQFGPCSPASLERQENLETKIKELAAAGVLQDQECQSLLELARAHAPASFEVGLVHGDFCAENIIVDDHGGIHVIDNETLTIDAYDYDLARTWYRWPMNDSCFRAYLRGYRRHRGVEGFVEHFPYWAISALIDSAHFRLRCDPLDFSTPLERLRALLSDPLGGIQQSEFLTTA